MEYFIGQILVVGFNFAPRDFAFCNGQLMSIADNTALFSLLGTTYGGDGVTTFALPDLRGRAAIGMGPGPGLSAYNEGEVSGVENTTLISSQLPAHTHALQLSAAVQVSTSNPSTDEAANGFLANTSNNFYATAGTPGNNLGGVSVSGTAGPAGGNQPVSIMQPYLAVNYVIALNGIYPSRA
jgi:microcystin-dependent protein